MLVQYLQDIDLEESSVVPEFASSSSQSLSVVGFALGVIGIALAFRLSTSILFGLRLPVELEWLNPREWVLGLGVAVNAAVYAIQNVDTVVAEYGAAELAGRSVAERVRALVAIAAPQFRDELTANARRVGYL